MPQSAKRLFLHESIKLFSTKVLSYLARKHTAHCAITRLPCTLTG